MSDKSRTICLVNVLAIFLCSLPCVYFLTLQEYVRLAILGLFAFSLLLIYRQDFAQAFWRRAVLGLSVIFVIYACDPLSAGSLDTSKEMAPVKYFYAAAVFFFAFVCFVTILVKLIFNRQAFKTFAKSVSLTEWLVYFVVLLALLFVGITDIVGMIREANDLVFAALICLKPLAAFVLFFVITRFCAPTHREEKREDARAPRFKLSFNAVALVFVIFAAYGVVFGGVRVTSAVANTRLTKRDFNRMRAKNQDQYDALMRAFSLCEEEAAKVYRLGYLAGERKYKEQGELADDPNGRLLLEKEALIGSLIGQDKFYEALFNIDSLDRNYHFSTATVTQQIWKVVQNAQKDNYLVYLLSRLHAMCGNTVLSRNYLQTFSFNYPDHPNAVFLKGEVKQDEKKAYVLPCSRWLVPMEDAQVERAEDELVMLNGRSVSGYILLPEGKYVMTLYARDEGVDHEKAKEMNFDPSCKAEVWLDDQTVPIKVFSQDRRFQPYEMEFQILKTPALFTLRFTNDKDEGKGLDRNLGLQKLEIRCVQ